MVNSKVEIWNQALSLIGETQLVQDENETTAAAEQCRLWYPTVLRDAFASTVWPFAIKQAELSQLSGVTRVGWDYLYTYPADCARPLALLPEDTKREQLPRESRIPYAVMADDAEEGKIIATDADSAVGDFDVLEYVAILETPTIYPPGFVQVVAWMLASKLAFSIRKDPQLASSMMQLLPDVLSGARQEEFAAGGFQRQPLPPSVQARS